MRNLKMYLALFLILISISACRSFSSQFSAKVEIYNGETETVDDLPDPHAIIVASGKTADACNEMIDNLNNLKDSTDSLVNFYKNSFDNYYVETMFHLTRTAKYLIAANNYLQTWKDVLTDLASLNPTPAAGVSPVSTEVLYANAEQKLKDNRLLFRHPDTNIFNKKLITDSVAVNPFIKTIIYRKIPTADGKKTFNLLRKALIGEYDKKTVDDVFIIVSSNKQLISDLKSEIDLITQLSATDVKLDKPVLAVDQFANTISETNDKITALTDLIKTGQIRKKYQDVMNAINSLNGEAMKLLINESGYEKTIIAANNLNNEVGEFGQTIQGKLNELGIEQTNQDWKDMIKNLPGTPLGAVIDVKIPAEEKKKINDVVNIKVGRSMKSTIIDLLYKAQTALAASMSGTSRAGESTQNVVAMTKARPFRAADNNIKTITDDINKDEWNTIPVSGLNASGDGNAQYVIIQDSPTNYRVKEFSVDPSSVIQFQLDTTDVAVGILKTVASAAASAYGVPLNLGKSSTSGESSNAEVNGDNNVGSELEEQILLEAMKTSIKGFSAGLYSQKQALERETLAVQNPQGTRRLKSFLKGYVRQLSTVSTHADRLSGLSSDSGNGSDTPSIDSSGNNTSP
jgi:hypothetical protein